MTITDEAWSREDMFMDAADELALRVAVADVERMLLAPTGINADEVNEMMDALPIPDRHALHRHLTTYHDVLVRDLYERLAWQATMDRQWLASERHKDALRARVRTPRGKPRGNGRSHHLLHPSRSVPMPGHHQPGIGGLSAAATQPHTGAVVMALVAGTGTVKGDPTQPLHVTLRYYGTATDLTDLARADILRRARTAAATVGKPITVQVHGRAYIGNDTPPATALLVEDDALTTLRLHLAPSDHDHPHFVPHITLGYGMPVDEVQVPFGTGMSIDRLGVAFGDDLTIVPLQPETTT